MSETQPHGAETEFFLWRDLVDTGWHDRSIRALLASGEWTRVRPGAYVETKAWKPLSETDQHVVVTRAAVQQSRTEVVVSHTSALAIHGAPLWGLDQTAVHLTRPDRKSGRRAAGIRQHRGALLAEDVVQRHALDVVTPTRAALEVCTVADAEAALVAMNHLLHRGATSMSQLQDRYERGLEHWPASLRTEVVLRRATDACESVGESRFWHLCATSGLGRPKPQHVVHDPATGETWRLDFAWPERWVFVEFDGRVKYDEPWGGRSAADVVLAEKRREDRIRELTGWLCVRVTWSDLSDRVALVRRLQRAFDQATHLRARTGA